MEGKLGRWSLTKLLAAADLDNCRILYIHNLKILDDYLFFFSPVELKKNSVFGYLEEVHC